MIGGRAVGPRRRRSRPRSSFRHLQPTPQGPAERADRVSGNYASDTAAGVEHGPERRTTPDGSVVASTVPPETEAGFLPTRPPRFVPESVLVRLIATIGVIAIGTLVGAILVANNVAGWITGLAVASVSVVLAAVLWRSRHM
jgi:hypothetical protein